MVSSYAESFGLICQEFLHAAETSATTLIQWEWMAFVQNIKNYICKTWQQCLFPEPMIPGVLKLLTTTNQKENLNAKWLLQ